MERSIATSTVQTPETRSSPAPVTARLRRALERADPAIISLLFVSLALLVYVISNPARQNFYNHFVWQADAFLDGRFAISWPVTDGAHVNDYFQDVMPLPDRPGYGLLPFPPLPAILLTPLVAVFGLGTNAALLAAALGAINVGLAWRMLLRVTDNRGAAVLATLFVGFGTVHWYAAMLGSTWFLAHVVATTLLLLAITLALDGERPEALRLGARRLANGTGRLGDAVGRIIDPVQFLAGVLFGLAATARLTVLLGAPFFVFVGGGGSFVRRALSAGLGALVPFSLLLAYNIVSTGHLFHPAYEHLYRTEYTPRPSLIHRDWAIEDPRYVPQNALVMLAWPPEVRTECGLSLFDVECPLLKPDPLGMSLLLTSPAYLLALPALLAGWRRRLVLGASLAVLAIAVVNLMHFSQGWVQFGYRFSNDFAPFALVLVGLGIGRLGLRPLTVTLVAASIAINAWGVYWGVVLRW